MDTKHFLSIAGHTRIRVLMENLRNVIAVDEESDWMMQTISVNLINLLHHYEKCIDEYSLNDQ